MNYKDFIEWVLSASVSTLDYDKVYGLQCVDLIKWYIKKVRGITPQSIGNANQYWYKRNESYIQSVIKNGGQLITVGKGNKYNFRAGDIVVMMKDGSSTGHICIASGDNSNDYFKSYDTNWSYAHSPTTLTTHRYSSDWYVLGVIRLSSTYTEIRADNPNTDDDGSEDTGKQGQTGNSGQSSNNSKNTGGNLTMATTYKKNKFFTPNATMKSTQSVYCCNKKNDKTFIGTVFKDEQVKVYFKGETNALIQYLVKDTYKVGLVKVSSIKQ